VQRRAGAQTPQRLAGGKPIGAGVLIFQHVLLIIGDSSPTRTPLRRVPPAGRILINEPVTGPPHYDGRPNLPLVARWQLSE
jgi:hypothetical protein